MKNNYSKTSYSKIALTVLLPLFIVGVAVYNVQKPKDIDTSLGAIAGNCNPSEDDVVNIIDFQLLSNAFGRAEGDTLYNPNCNFVLSTAPNPQIINVLDFQVLSNNFGNSGGGGSGTPTRPPQATATPRPQVTSGPIPSVTIPPLPGNPNFVVSSSGCSDTGPGNASQPFCTIPRAIEAAQPGNLIAVRGGTYQPFSVSKSGTAGNYITIAAANGERPKIQGGGSGIALNAKSYIRIVGFEITGAGGGYSGGGIYLSNGANNNIIESNITHDNLGGFTSGINVNASSNNKIVNNTSYNNGLKGIRVAQGGDNQIIGNHAYGNKGNGGGSDGITTTEGSKNNLIKDNIVHNNSDDGIDTWSSRGNTLIGNVVYDNLGPGDGNGLKLGGVEQGGLNLVIGNVSYNNKRDGFDSNHSYGNTYYNNVAVGNGGVGFRDVDKFPNCVHSNCKTTYINNIGYNNSNKNFAASPHTGTSHNNIWFSDNGGAAVTYQGGAVLSNLEAFYQATGNRLDNPNSGTTSSLSVNPSFASVGSRNFKLNSGSPAINKGDPANPGNVKTVGVPDIGAFEFGL